ncbi:MAG: DUF4116 domain-containing protein [Fibromonadaceae bacterium]|jgi:hypothetical protein|nr:DUF4116 domain-containing protein [Fibromonadaceae bacterium]
MGNIEQGEKITTVEQALEAVKHSGFALEFVPEELRTAEVCLEAIRSSIQYSILTSGNALEFVPEALKTAELCAEAVKNNYSAIKFVPKSLMTTELCQNAIKQSSCALQEIPEEFITQELCIEAVKDGRRGGTYALRFVPEKFKTTELYIEMIKNREHTWLLLSEYIPEKSKTAELWFEAVKKDGSVLCHVPEKFRTIEMYIEAVKNYCWALKYVPKKFRTLDMCIEAVKQEDWIFMLVPENLKKQVTKATGVQQGGTDILHYKYESVLEKGMKEIFEKEVELICIKLTECCEIARREGLMALENYIDKEKLSEKAFLETGMQMATDGTKREIIENYINSWIETNCNNSVAYYEKILASIIKTGILCVQGGYNPEVAEYKMTVLIPKELTPDSLLPEKETYFRRKNGN